MHTLLKKLINGQHGLIVRPEASIDKSMGLMILLWQILFFRDRESFCVGRLSIIQLQKTCQ